jgi:hypothetical protein
MTEFRPMTEMEVNALKWVLLCQKFNLDPKVAAVIDFTVKERK